MNVESPSKRKENTSNMIVPISDLKGGILSLLLTGPVQLPLRVSERGQIAGKDLLAIPISVELEVSGINVIKITRVVEKMTRTARKEIGTGNQNVNNDKTKIKNVYWNLKDEIAKVVEKGVALGYVFKYKETRVNNGGSCDNHGIISEGNSVGVETGGQTGNDEDTMWSLEDEIGKVLEVMVTLGFDFNSKEVEISGVITQREKEDEERLAEIEDS
ncbi:hypothetical protein Ddye_011824 [Dipteronia dyeriana]|uniref:Uncharacterized protein n=1 Tax=Dipteronia dyeriana TaxID=168575 RepID=A0AAD9X3E6_9ROSI|nr:hypothetical protein Ddye_011824 [Dipteronia dyeriana]